MVMCLRVTRICAYVFRSLHDPLVQVTQVHWSFVVFVPEGILNITTMACGSKRAHLCSVWWRTSNTWPWGSSPSPRNRGLHTCSLSYLAISSFGSCVSLSLVLSPWRLKPVQKVEGITNGMSPGSGQQQQQSSGLSDISTQVQQYQQFLGESVWTFNVKV